MRKASRIEIRLISSRKKLENDRKIADRERARIAVEDDCRNRRIKSKKSRANAPAEKNLSLCVPFFQGRIDPRRGNSLLSDAVSGAGRDLFIHSRAVCWRSVRHTQLTCLVFW
ncbi:hypothetical protein ACLOJK_031546 [Asimina triloba]